MWHMYWCFPWSIHQIYFTRTIQIIRSLISYNHRLHNRLHSKYSTGIHNHCPNYHSRQSQAKLVIFTMRDKAKGSWICQGSSTGHLRLASLLSSVNENMKCRTVSPWPLLRPINGLATPGSGVALSSDSRRCWTAGHGQASVPWEWDDSRLGLPDVYFLGLTTACVGSCTHSHKGVGRPSPCS